MSSNFEPCCNSLILNLYCIWSYFQRCRTVQVHNSSTNSLRVLLSLPKTKTTKTGSKQSRKETRSWKIEPSGSAWEKLRGRTPRRHEIHGSLKVCFKINSVCKILCKILQNDLAKRMNVRGRPLMIWVLARRKLRKKISEALFPEKKNLEELPSGKEKFGKAFSRKK